MPGAFTTGVSSTDDSDDYQSAVDVSSPPSEDDEPQTPQLNRFRASAMNAYIDQTPRESIDHATVRGR